MDLFITPLFTIGPFQIVVIVVVALIVFGPVGLGKKLGNLVKGTGQGVKEFKKALEEGKEDEAFYMEQMVDYLKSGKPLPTSEEQVIKALGL